LKTKDKNFMDRKVDVQTVGKLLLFALGAIFLLSGIGKIIKPAGLENIWVSGILGEQIMEGLRLILPYIEIMIGVFLILRLKFKWVSWVAMAMILNFIVNNVWLISIGKGFESCGQCLGWGIDTWPIGSLYMDMLMLGFLLMGANSYMLKKREVMV